MWGVGFRVWGVGFRVKGLVSGLDLRLGVWGLRLRA